MRPSFGNMKLPLRGVVTGALKEFYEMIKADELKEFSALLHHAENDHIQELTHLYHSVKEHVFTASNGLFQGLREYFDRGGASFPRLPSCQP